MGRRDPVLIAWVVGLGLAALAYAIGPQNFLFRVADGFHVAMWRVGEFVSDLSVVGSDAIRAAALGLYGAFVVLALSVLRRGGPAKGALVGVTLIYLFLIGGLELSTTSNMRWLLALAVAGAGAATMTGRLRHTALAVR